jgi:hypothetical protein
MFERLMTPNREAFDAGHYNTAYHTLAAALHEAQGQQAAQDLCRVQHVAEEQLAWIDQAAPAYEHSTPSAASRGHTSIFALLAHQAHTRFLMPQRKAGFGKREINGDMRPSDGLVWREQRNRTNRVKADSVG